MRASIVIVLMSAIFVAPGCSRSGDFGAFLTTEIARYGGHTITNATLSKLDARWTVKSDSDGFTAQASDVSFARVDSFMREAFGPPMIPTDINLDGQPQGVWVPLDGGVAIQCIGRPSGVEIVCLKRVTKPVGGGR